MWRCYIINDTLLKDNWVYHRCRLTRHTIPHQHPKTKWSCHFSSTWTSWIYCLKKCDPWWSQGIWDHWGLLEISHDSHKLFANLHAWKHWLDLPRRTCKISQSLHSWGMTMGAPSQYCGTNHSWVLETYRSTTLNKIY
jgi:hypothetical protein